MITQLGMRNFKSWRSIDAMHLAPITGLFGANSSGKTSIIQLLLLLKQTTEAADRTLPLNLGDSHDLVSLGTFEDLINAHRATEPLEIDLAWTLPQPLEIADPEADAKILFKGDALRYAASLRLNDLKQMIVNRLRYELGGSAFTMKRKAASAAKYEISAEDPRGFAFARRRGRPWDLPAPVKCYGFPDQVKAYYSNAGFLADFELAFEQLFRSVYYLGPLRDYPKREYSWSGAEPQDVGARGERAVDAILAAQGRGKKIRRGRGHKSMSFQENLAHWLRELKLIDSFRVDPIAQGSNLYRVTVQKSAKSPEALITDVGFGVSQILPVLVLCYYAPEGSTVILEQPEIHLHPSVQAGLADVFIDVIKHRRIQVIVESHSEHLLKRLQRRIAEQTAQADDAALYFTRIEDGHSRLERLELDDFGNITNWPDGFFGDEFEEMAAMAEAEARRRSNAEGE